MYALFMFQSVLSYLGLWQGPTISGSVEFLEDVITFTDSLIPGWQWLILAGFILAGTFALIRRARGMIR